MGLDEEFENWCYSAGGRYISLQLSQRCDLGDRGTIQISSDPTFNSHIKANLTGDDYAYKMDERVEHLRVEPGILGGNAIEIVNNSELTVISTHERADGITIERESIE